MKSSKKTESVRPAPLCDCSHRQACSICAESKEIDWSKVEPGYKGDGFTHQFDEEAAEEEIDQRKLAAVVLVIVSPHGESYTQNIDLDARLVLSSMKNGMDGLTSFAWRNRDIFPTPDHAVRRANWLKEQSEEYIKQVSEKAAELEKNV